MLVELTVADARDSAASGALTALTNCDNLSDSELIQSIDQDFAATKASAAKLETVLANATKGSGQQPEQCAAAHSYFSGYQELAEKTSAFTVSAQPALKRLYPSRSKCLTDLAAKLDTLKTKYNSLRAQLKSQCGNAIQLIRASGI